MNKGVNDRKYAEVLHYLRGLLPEGSAVLVSVRSVSSSGASMRLSFFKYLSSPAVPDSLLSLDESIAVLFDKQVAPTVVNKGILFRGSYENLPQVVVSDLSILLYGKADSLHCLEV